MLVADTLNQAGGIIRSSESVKDRGGNNENIEIFMKTSSSRDLVE